MPRKSLLRIAAVAAEEPFVLRIRWSNGEESCVDLRGVIESFRVFCSADLFGAVRVGEYGADIARGEDIDTFRA